MTDADSTQSIFSIGQAFTEAIQEAPCDPLVRRVYADWLEEQGQDPWMQRMAADAFEKLHRAKATAIEQGSTSEACEPRFQEALMRACCGYSRLSKRERYQNDPLSLRRVFHRFLDRDLRQF